jgi:hypothetical protein
MQMRFGFAFRSLFAFIVKSNPLNFIGILISVKSFIAFLRLLAAGKVLKIALNALSEVAALLSFAEQTLSEGSKIFKNNLTAGAR